MIYELTYISTAQEEIQEKDIKDILKTAQVKNAELNITGCLLFYGDQFVQILESENEDDLFSLFDKIRQDNRHKNIKLLYQGTKKKRDFNRWSMAYHSATENDFNSIAKRLFIDNFKAIGDLIGASSKTLATFWAATLLLLD